MSNHVDAAAEAIDQHIGGWQPENALDLDMFLSALPRLFESLSGALSHVADNLSDQHPVDPAVTERLREIASTVAGMSEHASEAHTVHRSAHERELERIENPRPNERLWDTVENN